MVFVINCEKSSIQIKSNFSMKTVINGGNIISSQSGVFQFIYIVFVLCQRNDCGGAIFINNYLSNCSIYYCSFERCSISGPNHGGSICIRESHDVKLHSVCFHNAVAKFCPGFVIWGHLSKRIQRVSMNYTTDCDHPKCDHNSLCFSLGMSQVTKSNFSNLFSTVTPGGFLFGSLLPSVICEYLTFYNIHGKGIITFYPDGSPEYNEIQYINVVSCSSESQLIHSFMPNKCIISKSIFANVTFTAFYYRYSQGIIDVADCQFSNSQNGIDFSNCILNNCTFNSIATLIPHRFLDSNKCWSSITIAEYTIHNYQPFAISHPIIMIFMEFIIFSHFA